MLFKYLTNIHVSVTSLCGKMPDEIILRHGTFYCALEFQNQSIMIGKAYRVCSSPYGVHGAEIELQGFS